MYNYINSIQTPLLPINQFEWEQKHEWPYSEIGKRIKTDNVIDIGSGCGLLGVFLIYNNYCKQVTLFETREVYLNYTRDLVNLLNLQHCIDIQPVLYTPGPKLRNTTIVSTRLGPLTEFEELIGNNTAITLRRTAEVEPYYIRDANKVWQCEIIKRSDGFELEALTR